MPLLRKVSIIKKMFREGFVKTAKFHEIFIEWTAIILYNVIVTANSNDSRGCWTKQVILDEHVRS